MIAPIVLTDSYIVLAEEEIVSTSIQIGEMVEDEEDNDALQILKAGNVYREAGLTPLYLYGETTGLTVTCNEYAKREIRLH